MLSNRLISLTLVLPVMACGIGKDKEKNAGDEDSEESKPITSEYVVEVEGATLSSADSYLTDDAGILFGPRLVPVTTLDHFDPETGHGKLTFENVSQNKDDSKRGYMESVYDSEAYIYAKHDQSIPGPNYITDDPIFLKKVDGESIQIGKYHPPVNDADILVDVVDRWMRPVLCSHEFKDVCRLNIRVKAMERDEFPNYQVIYEITDPRTDEVIFRSSTRRSCQVVRYVAKECAIPGADGTCSAVRAAKRSVCE